MTAKSLTIAVTQDEGTLTPYTNKTGYPGANLVRLIFDTLMVLDTENKPRPLLASDVKTSDSKVFTIPVRSGVVWHDGKPFTTEDVVFSVKFYQKFTGGDSAIDVRGIADVTSQGDTVTITLNRPDPEFPMRILADMPILAQHLWQSVTNPQEAGTELAIGTGPYKLTKYEKDRGYTLEANRAYKMGKPRIDTLRVTVIPDQQTQLAALQTNEIQMTTRGIPPSLVEQFKSQPTNGLIEGVDFPATLVAFNTGRSPFDRAEVRRALAKAINVDDLVKTVLLGKGLPGDPGFLHPKAPVKGEARKAFYDVAAAIADLDALGAKPGADGIRILDGKAMSYELLVQSASPTRVRAAELIKEMLQKVGVGVTIRAMDGDAVDAKVWPNYDVGKGRSYDMSMWGWSAPTMYDSTKIASLVASDVNDGRLNIVGLRDAQIDQIVQELLSSTTMDARLAVVKRLQARIAELVPFVTLYYPQGIYGFRKDAFAGWVYQNGAGIMQKLSLTEMTVL